MRFIFSARPIAVVLLGSVLFLTGCGGGGGSSAGGNAVAPTDDNTGAGPTLSFTRDIEPILQGKCQGCHNDGPNPLAPFSLG